MKRKKLVSLFLAAAMTAAMCLGGCGNRETADSGTDTPKDSAQSGQTEQFGQEEQSEEEASDKEELEEKTIQVWLGGPGKQADSDEVWAEFNNLLQQYVPNTTVEFTVIPTSEYKDKYSQMLAGNEPVDLAWVANWVTGPTSQGIRDGNMMELSGLLDTYGQGIKDALGEDIIDLHRESDGGLYYLICNQGLGTEKRGLFLPTELVELAGEGWLEETTEVVDKWWNGSTSTEDLQAVFDQFDKYLSACKDAGKLYAGPSTDYFLGWEYRSNLYKTDTDWVGVLRNSDFEVVDAVDTEYFKTYCRNMAEWYQKGYIRSDIASLNSRSDLHFVTDGIYDNNTTIVYLHDYKTEADLNVHQEKAGVEMSVIPIEQRATLAKGDATAMSIPYCADEPERAMMVLNAIYSQPDLYQLLIYGIEGRHYTDNGDGTVTVTFEGTRDSAESPYGLWNWCIGMCQNSLVTQTDTPGYFDMVAEVDKNARKDPLFSFSFDTDGVQDVVSALDGIKAEYNPMMQNGYLGADWETFYNKYVEERKAVGVDKLIEEYQKQLDAYLEEYNITSW